MTISYRKLFERLEEMKISRADLITIHGFDSEMIDRLENNDGTIRVDVFCKLREILNCTLNDIIEYTMD